MTVGTHEQPFDRLMREIDCLVGAEIFSDVVVQYGYSTLVPEGCRCEAFLSYAEMLRFYKEADAVVCHGGPSTFLEAMSYGKVPVVVPRLARFGEHVNDHQLDFCRTFSERVGGIEVVEDIATLGEAIGRVSGAAGDLMSIRSNTARFCEELGSRVEGLLRHG